jgi:hypothetical protein
LKQLLARGGFVQLHPCTIWNSEEPFSEILVYLSVSVEAFGRKQLQTFFLFDVQHETTIFLVRLNNVSALQVHYSVLCCALNVVSIEFTEQASKL